MREATIPGYARDLGEAARPFLRKGRSLPLRTPKYQHDVSAFARRYFRELFGTLPAGAIFVLDNYPEVDAAHPFHAMMVDAVAEVHRGQCLMVVSRRDPPDCYARLRANRYVMLLGWDDIKLNLDETAVVARMRVPAIETTAIDALHEHCGGWAAGLSQYSR